MQTGKAYLIHCGDWHTFVGRVSRQVTPLIYEFESCSKITETNNGDCWNALAAGEKSLREAANYRHHETHVNIPVAIAAIEWVGNTPMEDGLPE